MDRTPVEQLAYDIFSAPAQIAWDGTQQNKIAEALISLGYVKREGGAA